MVCSQINRLQIRDTFWAGGIYAILTPMCSLKLISWNYFCAEEHFSHSTFIYKGFFVSPLCVWLASYFFVYVSSNSPCVSEVLFFVWALVSCSTHKHNLTLGRRVVWCGCLFFLGASLWNSALKKCSYRLQMWNGKQILALAKLFLLLRILPPHWVSYVLLLPPVSTNFLNMWPDKFNS